MFNIKYYFMLVPIMIFYLIEAFIIALPFSLVWNLFLSDVITLQTTLKYLDWVLVIWIIRVLQFDIFKIAQTINEQNKNNDNNE